MHAIREMLCSYLDVSVIGALDTLKRQLNDALHYTEVNQEK